MSHTSCPVDPLHTTLADFTQKAPVHDLAGGVYAFVDGDGHITYIGQTGFFRQRLKAHERAKWRRKDHKILILVEDDAERRLVIEAALVLRYRPPANKALMLSFQGGHICEIGFVNRTRKGRASQARK